MLELLTVTAENDIMNVVCGTGFAVLCYSVCEGLGMVYDKIVHKTPILWEPN
jgi:hypothetical protein